PIIGPRGVNKEGSGDMYPKGGLMLNTLRSVINNDKLWFEILRGIQDTYRYKTIDADSIFNYVRLKTGTDYDYFFDQYLKHKALPKLDVALFKKGSTTTMRYRWTADVKSFRMPIRVTTTKDRYEWVTPTTEWQMMKLENLDPRDFKIEEDRFYVDKNIYWMFLDERLQ
ncbi:MAG TPA: M1 family peptidase, partial [bacterium]|nr:M1 family peptidase [bacterium]